MRISILSFIVVFIAVSCSPKSKGEIFNEGYCNIAGFPEKSSNEVRLRNTSSSEIVTFTIRERNMELNESKIDLYELAPGDEAYLGCDSDYQGHKSYEIVGAYYGKKN
jgi:hypothetical protein